MVRKTLLYTLFILIVTFGYVTSDKIAFSGQSVYSVAGVCTNDLNGMCSVGCEEGYHSIGVQDCAYVSNSAGSNDDPNLLNPTDCVGDDCDGGDPPSIGGDGFCGDGILQSPNEGGVYEECDIPDYGEYGSGSVACHDYWSGYSGGHLDCTFECEIDFSDCDEDQGNDDGGDGSPIILKPKPSTMGGEFALAVYDITGLSTSEPVCCVLNECYSNADCSADEFCNNFECIPNVQEIITQEDSESLSETVTKYSEIRQEYRINHYFTKNSQTYTFTITDVNFETKRVGIEYKGKTSYISEGNSITFDLDNDKVDDVQVLLQQVNEDKSFDLIISELEPERKSPSVEFFGAEIDSVISPQIIAITSMVALVALILIRESIRRSKKAHKTHKKRK